ncbi:DUF72 domain-containing protein, partial [Acinetobacter baumannii]
GADALYTGAYADAALDRWADRIRQWAAGREPPDAQRVGAPAKQRRGGRDIYCYFDNDKKVEAPSDARRLLERLQRAE